MKTYTAAPPDDITRPPSFSNAGYRQKQILHAHVDIDVSDVEREQPPVKLAPSKR
jgi:hypothetical protein